MFQDMSQYEGKRVVGPNGERGVIRGGQVVADTPSGPPAVPPMRQIMSIPKEPTPQTPAQATQDVNSAAASIYTPRKAEADADSATVRAGIDRQTAPDILRKTRADADKAVADAAAAKVPPAFNSESALQARGFFGRAQFSNQLYGGGVVPRDWASQGMADTLPEGFVKSWTSDPRKNAELAAREFVAATLRRESGAAIGPDEYKSQFERYFPTPGDGPEQIKIKGLLRQQAIKALADQAGAPFDAPSLPKDEPAAATPQLFSPPAAPPRTEGLQVDVSADNMPWETEEQYRARSQRGDPPPPPPPGWKGDVPAGYITDVRSPELDRQSPMQRLDAYMRGVADIPTFGMADKIAAGVDTLFGDKSMPYNLARQNAISDYDAKHYPGSRLTGQFAGGGLLPVGEMESLAQIAGKSAAVGGAYGAGSSRHLVDIPTNMAIGAAAGGATAAGLKVGGGLLGAGVKGVKSFFGPKSEELPPLVDPASGRVNQVLESAKPAQRMAAAKDFGIDLPMGAAGDKSAAIIEKGLDRLPASAGVMNDTRRTLGNQLDSAVADVSSRYGTGHNVNDLGAAGQKGAKNWLGHFDVVTEKAYKSIPISDDAPSALANTRATLGDLTSAFSSNPNLAEALKSSKLEQYSSALQSGGLSWRDLNQFRSRIGYELGEQRFSDGPTKDQLRALYGALSEDMRATAAQQGPRALRAFERANNLYKQGQDRIDGSLVALLGDDSKNNPERAAAKLMGIVTSKTSGNLDMLRGIRASNLKGNTWGDVASSLINLMGQPRNSEGRAFSPETFVQNYSDMAEPARNLIFGDHGRADLRKALDQFVMVNQRLAGTDALRNTSNTVPGLIGAGAVMSVASNLAHAVTHPVSAFFAATGLAGAAGANYGMAKLWTNPRFINWATGYTKALASQSPGATKAQFGRLRQLAAQNPAIRDQVERFARSLMQHANDNVGQVSRSAAGNNEENQQDQYGP